MHLPRLIEKLFPEIRVGNPDEAVSYTHLMKLSAENHAKISYSERNNRFNLIPGEGRNIIYLNGEEVFAAMPLKLSLIHI